MKTKCHKCHKAYTEGSDGYCRDCLEQEQKNIIGKWNNLSNVDKKKETD